MLRVAKLGESSPSLSLSLGLDILGLIHSWLILILRFINLVHFSLCLDVLASIFIHSFLIPVLCFINLSKAGDFYLCLCLDILGGELNS